MKEFLSGFVSLQKLYQRIHWSVDIIFISINRWDTNGKTNPGKKQWLKLSYRQYVVFSNSIESLHPVKTRSWSISKWSFVLWIIHWSTCFKYEKTFLWGKVCLTFQRKPLCDFSCMLFSTGFIFHIKPNYFLCTKQLSQKCSLRRNEEQHRTFLELSVSFPLI